MHKVLRGFGTAVGLVVVLAVLWWGVRSFSTVARPSAPVVAAVELPTLVPTAPALVLVTATPTPLPSPTATAVANRSEMRQQPSVPPTAVASPTPVLPQDINGLAYESILLMPADVRENVRDLFVSSVAKGRNPRAFIKVGDSTIENEHFLSHFDDGEAYELGAYGYLQETIDYFAGSFSRDSTAVRIGFHSWTMLDPYWADKAICQANETPLACEIRLHNPTFALVRLGSNDVGVPDSFDRNMREIVESCLQAGVIPILGTKADRNEGGDNINNQIIRTIAADYALPLWDFDTVAATIPGRGLDQDGIHMTVDYVPDYSTPLSFGKGHGVHNLTALVVLDLLRETVQTK